jgi:hypothetical protein
MITINYVINTYLLDLANIYLQIYNIMSKKDLTLTSVKIQSDLFEEFKVACVRHKFSFQKLADRAIHLYLTDEDFKRQIHNHNNIEL